MTLIFYLIIDALAIFFMAMAENRLDRRQFYPEQLESSYASHNRLTLSRRKFYLGLSFTMLFLVVALRDGVGKDYAAYEAAYDHIARGVLTSTEKDWLSVGYRVLCKAISIVASSRAEIMFAVVGFLTLFFIYKSMYRMSAMWAMSLYIYICSCLYYQCFNQSRQMLALAITTFALQYLEKNDLRRYVIWVAIAALIHTSAIVMLVMYFVKNWKMNVRNIGVYVIVCIVSYIGFDRITHVLQYTNYGQTYLGWSRYNTSFEMSSILNLIIRLALLIACLFFSKETIKRAPYTQGLYNAAIICTILQVLTLRSYLFGRVTTYFFIGYIFLIPEVMITVKRHIAGRAKFYVEIAMILLWGAYHFVYYFSSSGAVGSGYEIYKSLIF